MPPPFYVLCCRAIRDAIFLDLGLDNNPVERVKAMCTWLEKMQKTNSTHCTLTIEVYNKAAFYSSQAINGRSCTAFKRC